MTTETLFLCIYNDTQFVHRDAIMMQITSKLRAMKNKLIILLFAKARGGEYASNLRASRVVKTGK